MTLRCRGGRSRHFVASLLLATASMLTAAHAEVVEELTQLPSTGDARLPVLLSHDDAQPPRAAAVLFNGGGGAVKLLQRIPKPGANFLVRTRGLFASRGVATAVMKGVVPTSSVFNATRGGTGVAGFDWNTIQSRLLFVHHADDTCVATPYWMARRVASSHTLVTAHGGDAPRSDPCEPFSPHGYYGIEAPVVDAIVKWIDGGEPPKDVP